MNQLVSIIVLRCYSLQATGCYSFLDYTQIKKKKEKKEKTLIVISVIFLAYLIYK